MRALVSEHQVYEVPVAWAFLLAFLALAAAWFSLVALRSRLRSGQWAGQADKRGTSSRRGREVTDADLAFTAV